MVIDRNFQRELLQELREHYPHTAAYNPEEHEKSKLAANLLYLEQHGLCESGVEIGQVDGHIHFGNSIITARGLDFLEDDGGLSAILGVITVKLHADTIRDLITEKIEAAPLPEAEKSKLKGYLATISEAGLKAVTTDLVKAG